MGIGKPDAVVEAEAGVAIDGDAEAVAEQLLLDHPAQRLALRLHGRRARAAIPGQARAEALAAEQERHPLVRLDRGVAHQVDALRVGAGAAPQAARVDHRHEHHAQAFELLLQAGVPAQAHQHAVQVGQHHGAADTLQAVHAAEEADRRDAGRGVAEADGVHRQAALADVDLAQHAGFQTAAELVEQAFQFEQLDGLAMVHATSAGQAPARGGSLPLKDSSAR
ncbi:hypothetical protein D3C81_1551920 [compost metagenome]